MAAAFKPDARLRGLVPTALRDDEGREAIAARFRFWWEGCENWELLDADAGDLADLVHVRWRVRWTDPDEGPKVFEQMAYAAVEDDGIAWMNLVCSGNRTENSPS